MIPSVAANQFELIAAATGLLTAEEMDALIAVCDAEGSDGLIGGGLNEASYRRSKVAWVKPETHGWLYQRVLKLASGFNERFFGVEITGIEQALQIARYDADTEGGYGWHTDFGRDEQTRKISISVQLSDGDDYEGGDLELDVSTEPTRAARERGVAIAFPSYVRHRVAPVTQGVRYSLVAWVHGPRWR
ncbi:MAG: 2OG-Fe(II) oxygenase [Pseudomonadota bacterium]